MAHQEDLAAQGAVQSTFAVPDQLTRRSTLAVARSVGPFKVDVGGIMAGTERLGVPFTRVVEASGEQSYLDSGYDVIYDEIVLAVRTVAMGRKYISQAVATLLAEGVAGGLDRPPHELLSERELQVFLRLAKGETIGAMAEAMFLSVKTVSTYRTRVLEKLKLSSNSDLTYYAMTNGLIQ